MCLIGLDYSYLMLCTIESIKQLNKKKSSTLTICLVKCVSTVHNQVASYLV
jgi:hypothetical protein